ncbi:MAG: four helix bundle protein [Bacteroidota bacterium]
MTVERFEDLIIWREARELVKSVYKLTSKSPLKNDYGLKDQYLDTNRKVKYKKTSPSNL